MGGTVMRGGRLFALLIGAIGCRPGAELVDPTDGTLPIPRLAPVDFPPEPGTPTALADSWWAACGQRDVRVGDLLTVIADGLTRQRIPYGRPTPDEWRDCSGAFLRLSSYLASACPGSDTLAAPPGVEAYRPEGPNVPDVVAYARSSRDLARFMHAQGRFVPITYGDTPKKGALSAAVARYRHLLKPGAVVWFSQRPLLEPLGGELEQLLVTNLKRTHIHHVGTVVDVEQDEDGEVIAFAMFHGRNPGQVASITTDHRVDHWPPFGNADQYLTGIGTLLPPIEPGFDRGGLDLNPVEEGRATLGDED